MSFETENKQPYTLEYEPVLVSSKVKSNIFGAKTENRFKTCVRDLENATIVYTTRDQGETVKVKCYKEKINATTAFIEVAKVSYIEENKIKFVKGRIRNTINISKENSELFEIKDNLTNSDMLVIRNYTTESLNKTVSFPVENISELPMELEKVDILAEVLEVADDIHVANNEHLNENEEKRLLDIFNIIDIKKVLFHFLSINLKYRTNTQLTSMMQHLLFQKPGFSTTRIKKWFISKSTN